MTKQEIRDVAASHGIEARYRGNDTEDNRKGFFFIPVLLNNLESLKHNQRKRLEADPENVKLKEELQLTIERIEFANNDWESFKQTKVYTTEKEKHETSTI